MTIINGMLSPYILKVAEEMGVKLYTGEKRVPNLYNKTRYILHYRNLKQYLSLGLDLKQIHRCLRFEQSTWLEEYIAFNTKKRRDAKNTFEKICSRKTMENLRNRVDVPLVQIEKVAKKLVALPAFHRYSEILEYLVAIQRRKTSLLLNRPIYVGFSILDINKILMYDFHYSYMRIKFNDKAKLLFADTDSLCYKVETEDLYVDMQEDSHLFDTSDYPSTHPLYSLTNKKGVKEI